MTRSFKIFTGLWITATLVVAVPNLYTYVTEQRALRDLAEELAPRAADTHEVAREFLHRVRDRVAITDHGSFYDVSNRPLLRHTAWETWSHGEGQCGEGTRLLVNLLQSRGIAASRINLIDAREGFYHTPVAYNEDGRWWLLNSLDGGGEFHEWTLENRLPVEKLVERRLDPGGALVIRPNNPYFARYSYFNWARVFGDFIEINQWAPFPQWFIHIIENPPLTIALAVLFLSAVGWLLALAITRRSTAAAGERIGQLRSV